jgi:hypothetical protein
MFRLHSPVHRATGRVASQPRLLVVIAAAVAVVATGCADTTRRTPAEPLGAETALAYTQGEGAGVVKDRYIVVFTDGVADPGAQAREFAATVGGSVHFVYDNVLHGFSGTFPPAAIEAIRRSRLVSYVEPVQYTTLAGSGDQLTSSESLDLLDQRTLTTDGYYSWDADGSGTYIYIIDTGVNTSAAEFGGRATTVADFSQESGYGTDCRDHGTQVAGLAAGSAYGVAKAANIRSVRVWGCTNGTGDQLIAGLNWVANNAQRPAIANVSITAPRSTSINTALYNLSQRGVYPVSAAGNNGGDACNYSPASASGNVFVVGNARFFLGTLDRFPGSEGSNYGSCVTMWTVGQGARTIDAAGQPFPSGGTSAATPQVSGWIALYVSTDPTITGLELRDYAQKTAALTVDNAQSTFGKLLYTRFRLVSLIRERDSSVPAGSTFTYTSKQYKGVAPFTFNWSQNGVTRCTTSSCAMTAYETPGYGDVVVLTTTDAVGTVTQDTRYLWATCWDGSYNC